MPLYRIHNANFDVEIEADDTEDLLEQFRRDYPHRVAESVVIRIVQEGGE